MQVCVLWQNMIKYLQEIYILSVARIKRKGYVIMFQPIEGNISVYKKVVIQIQNMIMNGELKKGDRLPPERQLAEMLQVGRPALKQALSALEVLGIIRSRQGDGNYITSDSMDVLNPLAIRFYLDNGNSDDVLEFRYIMEVQMASLAAMKITEEQIDDFQNLMDSMKREIQDGAELEKRIFYNNLFHYKIVSICDNNLIKSIYGSIMDLISDQISQTDGMHFYESHWKIFQAIKEGKPGEAAFYMSEHFQNKFPNYEYYLETQKL